ncbi:MAG: PAS domain S-box protein [Candidatus Diapherotrites archaeon]|nr:PAS domain S-box protein [Candidatus Diapherotrites archaeon]
MNASLTAMFKAHRKTMGKQLEETLVLLLRKYKKKIAREWATRLKEIAESRGQRLSFPKHKQRFEKVVEYITEEIETGETEQLKRFFLTIAKRSPSFGFSIEEVHIGFSVLKEVMYEIIEENTSKPEQVKLRRLFRRVVDGDTILLAKAFLGVREEELRTSEEKYRFLVENSTDTIFTIGLDAKFSFINKHGIRTSGFSEDELVGKPFTKIIPKKDRKKAMGIFRQVMQGKTIRNVELPVLHKNGEVVIMEFRAKPIYKEGKSIGGIGVGRDITERKKMEKQLRETTERLKKILMDSTVSIIIVDKKGHIEIFNKGAQKLTGYSQTDVVGKPVDILFSGEDKKVIVELLKTKARAKGIEAVFRKKNGKTVPVALSISNLYGNQKNPSGAIIIAIDVSKIERIKQELVRERDFAKKIIETSPSLIVVLDKRGRILLLNKWAEKILKCDREKYIGKSWFTHFLRKEDIIPLKKYFKELLKGNVKHRHRSRVVTTDGKTRTIEWDNAIIYDEKGDIEMIISIGRDITEQLRLEEELKKRLKELETFKKFAVGRELRIIELKNRIKQLEAIR